VLLYDEALKTGKAPKYKAGHQRAGEIQDLLDWQFQHLLDVAKKAKWLPRELSLDKRWIAGNSKLLYQPTASAKFAT
jgi:hypothetical protein